VSLPREARDGLMRAWLEILRERHPGTTWIAANQDESTSATLDGRDTGEAAGAVADEPELACSA
jgi:hypothetical protein